MKMMQNFVLRLVKFKLGISSGLQETVYVPQVLYVPMLN